MLHQYVTATYCVHCNGLLWGAAGQQGWQCQNCEYNSHRACIENINDDCSKRKKDKENRKSMLDKFSITRKQTNTNPNAIEAALRGDQLRSSNRTISLPSINQAGKRTSMYISPTDTPPTTPVNKSMPKDHEHNGTPYAVVEDVRSSNSGRVQGMIQQFTNMAKGDGSPSPRGKSPDPDEESKRKGIIGIGRSESLNKKGEKRKSVRRTRSDVQVDEQTVKALDPSGSSSTSSLSNRSTESASNSNDGINESISSPPKLSTYQDDSDFEVEVELPSLDKVIPKEMLKKLKPKDKKRQDVLNELLYTEKNHCRNLKVMHRFFYVPMRSEAWISRELVKILFPNLEELITVHGELNSAFKKLRAASPVIPNVAQILLDRFQGESGEKFKVTCAKFCRNQSHALDLLRHRLRKDQKLSLFLQEASSNTACRRLQLQDIIPTAMQRLTKYPLLIDNLLKYTSSNTEEYALLQSAQECSKSVLEYVNQAVKDCENMHKLDDLQKRMDKRQIENSTDKQLVLHKKLDLLQHKLIYDGALIWKVNKSKQIDVHVVLLEDLVILLQKQDEKLVLRCQDTGLASGRDDSKYTHSPIINVQTLMVKQVATDKKGIFLLSTPKNSLPQIYELVAYSTEEKKKWFKHFTDVAKLYEGKEGPIQHTNRSTSKLSTSFTTGDLASEALPPRMPVSESADQVSSILDNNQSGSSDVATKSRSAGNLNKYEQVEVREEMELIQPDEVTVSSRIVVEEKQESKDNVYDKLQEQEEIIQKAMAEKMRLFSKAFEIPPEDFNNVAELASEDRGKSEPSQFLVASIHQSKRLTTLVNDNLSSMNIPSYGLKRNDSNENSSPAIPEVSTENDNEPVVSEEKTSESFTISLPSKELLTIANKLSDQLQQLMVVLQKKEEERFQMQKQLHQFQEQLLSYQQQQQKGVTSGTTTTTVTTASSSLSDSDHTPVTTPTALTQDSNLTIHNTELHISELDVSSAQYPHSSSPATSPSNSCSGASRPVSFISVTSETSESEQPGDDDEFLTIDSKKDGGARSPSLAINSKPLLSSETSHSSSSSISSNNSNTTQESQQFDVAMESDADKLHVLENTVISEKSDTPHEEEAQATSLNTEIVAEKLEIIEEDKSDEGCEKVEDSVDGIHDVVCCEEESDANDNEVSNEIKTDEQFTEANSSSNNSTTTAEHSFQHSPTATSSKEQQPIVISTETLVRNLDTTQMVTSETQTYETVAQVTEFTENIVAETIVDDENANIEYTPDVIPQKIGGIDEDVQEGLVCVDDQHIQTPGTSCMEMDCQTEMDPELLALIEAAEKIEAEREAECVSSSSSEEEIEEDIVECDDEEDENTPQLHLDNTS